MKMRALLAGGTALLLVSATASPGLADNFTGFYAGLQLGDTFGDASSGQSTAIGGALSVSQDDYKLGSMSGGVHAGYTHQFGSILGGAVVDFTHYDDQDSDTQTNTDDADADADTDSNNFATTSITSLRAKGGFMAWANTLIFATAGYSWMKARASVNYTITDTTTESGDGTPDNATLSTAEGQDVNFSGFTYGLGAEFVMMDNMTIGLEWKHHSFGEERVSFTGTGNDYDLGFDPDLDTVQMTMSYHFAGMLN